MVGRFNVTGNGHASRIDVQLSIDLTLIDLKTVSNGRFRRPPDRTFAS
jgi:hypothetical protein